MLKKYIVKKDERERERERESATLYLMYGKPGSTCLLYTAMIYLGRKMP